MYNKKAIKCYEEGRTLQEKGKLSDAERAYKKAIKINQEFFEAHTNLGNVLQDRGKLKEATNSFRKAQKLLPDNPMLLSNLGNALQLQGENEKAIGWLNKAIIQDTNYADAHSNLGNALRDLGRLGEAVASYKHAIKINSGLAEAYINLGGILIEMGELDDAVTNFKKAIEIDPGHKDAYNGLGNALRNHGEIDEAIAAYHKAIEIDPRHKNAYNGLGNAFSDKDETDKAIASFRKAIEIDSGHKNAYNGLGNALSAKDEIDKAIIAFCKAIEIDPRHKNAYNGLGRAQSDLGEINNAIVSFRKAIEIDPDHKEAYQGLGSALSDHGEIDKAIASYRKAIEINPESVGVYRVISKNKKFCDYDDDIQAMESLYANESNSDEQIMHLAFGLGKAYEDLGEYEKAMEFILQATRLKRTSFDYSITETQDSFRIIKETFSSEYFSDRKGTGNPDETPIFILGMPRSGTSLTEQILASHPSVYGAGELKYLINLTKKMGTTGANKKYPESITDLDSKVLENLGKEYIARIRHHSKSTKHITDKMPHNFQHVGLIKAILPNARIIRCTRDPMDNCLSIFKNFFGSAHNYSYNLTELGQYYKLYLDLMEYWRNTLPGFIYETSYERLVADQENQTRKLLEYCNLPWDDACLDFHKTRRKVKTASNAQVRRPIYQDSVKLWKRYEKQLEPLRLSIYG